MDFGAGTYELAFLAGGLSILSPCVLPLVPVLIATAVNAHRFGVASLGLGLLLSFTGVGIFFAAAGTSFGLDSEVFRMCGGVMLVLFGVVLALPPLQGTFARVTSGIGSSSHRLLSRIEIDGVIGQFIVGLLLGIVWTPCVGPTLGAVTMLASQGKDLGYDTLLMAVFGLGATVPFVLLGLLSRTTIQKIRGRLLTAGQHGRQLLGITMVVFGALIVTNLDKSLEAWILAYSPQWLITFTTRF